MAVLAIVVIAFIIYYKDDSNRIQIKLENKNNSSLLATEIRPDSDSSKSKVNKLPCEQSIRTIKSDDVSDTFKYRAQLIDRYKKLTNMKLTRKFT